MTAGVVFANVAFGIMDRFLAAIVRLGTVACWAGLLGGCSNRNHAGAATIADAGVDPMAPVDGALDSAPDGNEPLPIPDAGYPKNPCNGEPAYCDVAYDELCYAMTHASAASATPPFVCPTQRQPIRTQLDQGIRALEFEVHEPTDGGAALEICAGSCEFGELPFAAALAEVRAFFDVNPRQVVTLLVPGGVAADRLESALQSAHLADLALPHSSGEPFPTLGAMIEMGKRLVVLADVSGAPSDWVLPLSSYVVETGRTFETPSAMTCAAAGASSGPLYLLNEYLAVLGEGGATAACSDAGSLAQAVTAKPFFENRVQACTAQHGSKPTFIAVDDYDEAVFTAVRSLNPRITR